MSIELKRIAMWSGPRNISTALMRAWEARSDTIVCDEPLYAHYLKETGLNHPGATEIIGVHQTDWRVVAEYLSEQHHAGAAIFYQKQMAHHLLSNIDIKWVDRLSNCFLIRNPASMVLSLSKIYPKCDLNDTGLPQQVRLFEREQARTGTTPVVIDSSDVLRNPKRILQMVCRRLDIPYTENMLTWKPGERSSDGIWAKHWYSAVEQTTGFQPYCERNDLLPDHLKDVVDRCRPYYETLSRVRLTLNN